MEKIINFNFMYFLFILLSTGLAHATNPNDLRKNSTLTEGPGIYSVGITQKQYFSLTRKMSQKEALDFWLYLQERSRNITRKEVIDFMSALNDANEDSPLILYDENGNRFINANEPPIEPLTIFDWKPDIEKVRDAEPPNL